MEVGRPGPRVKQWGLHKPTVDHIHDPVNRHTTLGNVGGQDHFAAPPRGRLEGFELLGGGQCGVQLPYEQAGGVLPAVEHFRACLDLLVPRKEHQDIPIPRLLVDLRHQPYRGQHVIRLWIGREERLHWECPPFHGHAGHVPRWPGGSGRCEVQPLPLAPLLRSRLGIVVKPPPQLALLCPGLLGFQRCNRVVRLGLLEEGLEFVGVERGAADDDAELRSLLQDLLQ
mmetsp:Transcript_23259/g.59742  ORF Transcript_23259/g.59742 Transcript_23259/m.59742 type:complete len:227 (-) Transcript_23259:533-1213(-)